jgi:hypothetical protein
MQYTSVSHRCPKCGYLTDPQKAPVEQLVEGTRLTYQHAGECPAVKARGYNAAAPTHTLGTMPTVDVHLTESGKALFAKAEEIAEANRISLGAALREAVAQERAR